MDGVEDVDILKAEKLREEVTQLRLRNAVLEGKSIPAEGITKVMAIVFSQTCDIIDSLPLAIARKFPDLDKRIIDMFSEVSMKHQYGVNVYKSRFHITKLKSEFNLICQ